MSSKKALIVCVNVPHMGKPHKPLDRGAICNELIEANLSLQYASQIFKKLTTLGHKPFLITHGYYGQRAAFANKVNADLYLDCHLNSSEIPPQKNYSLVEISEHSGSQTRNFALHLSLYLKLSLNIPSRTVKVLKEGERGWSCINRVKASALLLEPFFLNHPDIHDHITKHILAVADAVVEAITTFNWEGI